MSEEHRDDWNPRDASILADQRREYDQMRERCPVAHSEFMGWSLFRHEDITGVLADSDTYSNASRYLAIPNGMDPPIHGRYRTALEPHFTEAQMTKIEPSARAIAVNLLGSLVSDDETEFMGVFAMPFVMKTLCSILGWPEQHWECLGGWTHGSRQAAFSRDSAAGKALASLFSEHVKINLAAHRATPNDEADATDRLLKTQVDGVQLDDDQIVSVLRNWAAGHGTVAAALGNVVLHLARDHELQDRLRRDPSLIPAAIEEILRVDGPLVANRRTTTQEVEIQGRVIPKGGTLSLMWIAANRDPRAFEDAHVVKIERNTDSSMVWGQGIHVCMGASLARLEMRVAIEELLSRTKRFAFAADAPHRTAYPSNGLAVLPLQVSWSLSKS